MTTTTTTNTAVHDYEMVNAKIAGYGKAYSIAVIFNALLLMLKESVPGVQDFMKALGHHWISHGAFVLIVFVGLGIYFSNSGKEMSGSSLVNWIVGSTILGGLMIVGWFVIVG